MFLAQWVESTAHVKQREHITMWCMINKEVIVGNGNE